MDDKTARQISPIKIYNPEEEKEESECFGECLCCGEGANTHGMCIKCAQSNCSKSLTRKCKRTGVKDPLNLSVVDEEEFLDFLAPIP